MHISKLHKFSLLDQKPRFESEHGSIQSITADSLPVLKNLSIERVVLKPNAIRSPRWLVNANEMGFVLKGKALVSILGTSNNFNAFTLTQGEMFHVKNGALHHIENAGDDDLELLIAYRHERPVDFGLANSFAAFTPAVIGNTYDHDMRDWKSLIPQDTMGPKEIVKRQGPLKIPEHAHWPNPNKFNNAGMQPPVNWPNVGSARTARSQFWPALEDMAMYNLLVLEDGMREPHWHPLTGEMGYVEEGDARMTVMDPDGSLDTFTLQKGDVYFIPASFPHHIECVKPDHIQFLIFFDQPMPQDVAFRTGAELIGADVLASSLGVPLKALPAKFPVATADPLIVARKNPVDP